MTIQVKARIEVKSTVDKASIILENTSIVMNRILGRNMNIKVASGEVSGGNEGSVIIRWEKDHFCYEGPKPLAELRSIAWCRAEFISDKLGYLAEDNSDQSVLGLS